MRVQTGLLLFPLLLITAPLLAAESVPLPETAANKLKDPTRPANYRQVTVRSAVEGSYRLQSVMVAESRRAAMINDSYVTVGEMIDGARVLSIDDNSVQLSASGTQFTLHLFDRTIRN